MKGNKKVSRVKKSNQMHTKLSKQGKMKLKRNRKKVVQQKPQKPTKQDYSSEEEEEAPYMDNDDLDFLQNAVSNQSFAFLTGANLYKDDPLVKKKKRKSEDQANALEDKYEKQNIQPQAKKQKFLLPIKTAEGFVSRTEDVADSDEEQIDKTEGTTIETKEPSKNVLVEKFVGKSEVSTSELLASRHEAIQSRKFRIGLLCSGLLESPEGKVSNFKSLLDMLDERDPLLRITVRKLVLVSLVEVFNDLLPSYQIRHSDDPNVKLKKDVKHLHEYESSLLKAYKQFLMKTEKIISILKKKKGDTRTYKPAELTLAELALQCLCNIFSEHTYFNFSTNIVHLIVPFLNNSRESVRDMVSKCIKQIFKTDGRGEVSLEIVRSINKLVKSRHYNVQPAALSVFLYLKLKDINLDTEKEEKLKEKKLQSKKQNVLRLSKRERKREKRLKELNQELLETQAEESKSLKAHQMTEITKIVFALYFNVLKVAPSSKLLSASLEGISKFAHCINLEFYQDLIMVLDHLIENESLGYREQLRCVQTVFSILSYQGATINIDPIRFYTHFYGNLLNIDAGKNHSDVAMVLSAAESVVIKRRKHLSLQRLLAFTKRLSTLSLQVLPNGALGLLTLVRQVLQLSKASSILVDTDSSFGKGIYQPELEEPEYCNAGATALWELLPLQRHFHPTVRKYASFISTLGEKSGEASSGNASFLKKGPCELFAEYDASEVKFVPPVPQPKTMTARSKSGGWQGISDPVLKEYMQHILSSR